MANIPLIHLSPTTTKMLANYHANNGSNATELRWLRVALVLFATNGYNDGHLTETDMHGILDLAYSEDAENLRTQGYKLLKGC